MEVDLSPEEYFRHHAAAALLHSEGDAPDDAKEAWSDIDDVSGAEEDLAVLKKKRILRHGRRRLAEMRDRFNANKASLYEARQQQLDLEWAQLQDGSHPRYREFVEQVDARWSDRLHKIEQKMECGSSFAQKKLESSQRAALNTFVAGRGELRRGMIYRRQKHMWALTDELRNLEKIREAIVNIACPLSNLDTMGPVRGSLAARSSDHLLALPSTRLSKHDEDADVSAICGIPALLNHSDTDVSMPEDAVISPAMADAAVDTRVPASQLTYAANEPFDASAYSYRDAAARHDSSAGHAGANGIYAAAAPPDHEYYQYGYGGHPAPAAGAPGSVKPAYAAGSGHEHHRRYYDAGVGDYASYQASADQKQPPPPAHQSKISDLLMQPSADSYAQDGRASSGRHPSAYYDTGAHAAATLGHSATALGKHDMAAVDYDAAPSKRQRMAQSSTTWPAAASLSYGSHHAQAYSAANVESDGRHSVDPAAAVRSYGYGHHSDYHQKHSASQVPSATYAPGTHQQQYHQAPGDQRAAYQYGQQHYRQQQQPPPPPQHGYHHRQSASSSAAAYYGTPAAKYDYASDAPASYYQRRPHQGSAGTGGAPPPVASGVSGAVPQHKQVYYNSADGTYYRSASTTHYQQQHQQQHQLQQVVAGARSSDPYYSYNQSATASAAAAAAAGYTSQQHQPGSEYAGGWSDYYQQSQQYANQPPGASGQPSAHQRYPQEPRASASRAGTQHGTEYYESNGYYAGSHPQRTAAPDAQMYYPGTGENGGDPRRYPTLPNLLK
ncbi:hypothetical protein GGI02_002010 [Coemansia sp. RSA 2322]|nr:hypothetical protein GGI02_002010 [Coemansia sp. RSA 2322]